MIIEILNRQFELTDQNKKLPKKTIESIKAAVKYISGMNINDNEIETLWKSYCKNSRRKK